MKIGGVELNWLGHSGFLIENSKRIYIDPYNVCEGLPKADLILLTHDHQDHCSIADIQKIITPTTKIIAPADCQSKVLKFDSFIMQTIEVGDSVDFGQINITAFPAYNIDKHFHPKDSKLVGYLIRLGDFLIYHSGDTDVIPEMQNLTGFNQKLIALLPVGGRYTMCAEEAAEAAKIIKPFLAIPMHYGSGVAGTFEDAKEFVELCELEGVDAKILEKI